MQARCVCEGMCLEVLPPLLFFQYTGSRVVGREQVLGVRGFRRLGLSAAGAGEGPGSSTCIIWWLVRHADSQALLDQHLCVDEITGGTGKAHHSSGSLVWDIGGQTTPMGQSLSPTHFLNQFMYHLWLLSIYSG